MHQLGDELRRLLGGAVADSRKNDELRVAQVGEEFGSGMNWNGAVAVAPEDERGSEEFAAHGAAQTGHVLVPGSEQTKQMKDGSGRAEIVAIGLETLRGVRTLRAGHAAKSDHLDPLGEPGHDVGKDLTGPGEIEADERISFLKVGVGGSEQDERMDSVTVTGGKAEGDGPAVGVAKDHGLMQLHGGEKAADVLGGDAETRVDVFAALGLAGTGEVECDDVQVGVECIQQRAEGFRAAHEAVKQDERGLILHRRSPFEVRETKTVHTNVAAFNHRLWCCIFWSAGSRYAISTNSVV